MASASPEHHALRMRGAASSSADRDGRLALRASLASCASVLDGTPVQITRNARPFGHARRLTARVGISYSNSPPCMAAATSMPLPAPCCRRLCASSASAKTSTLPSSAASSATVSAALEPMPVLRPPLMNADVSSSMSRDGRLPRVTASMMRKRSTPLKPGVMTRHSPSVRGPTVATARRSTAMQIAGAPQSTAYSPASTILPGALATSVTCPPPTWPPRRGRSSSGRERLQSRARQPPPTSPLPGDRLP